MHQTVINELEKWYNDNIDILRNKKIADIGSYNVNGSVRDVIPNVVGFDIVNGDEVDVKIESGIIPDEYKNKFQAVTTTSSFQFAPNTNQFIKQIIDLLTNDGLLILTMCPNGCFDKHSTSPGHKNNNDKIRISKEQLYGLFNMEFKNIVIYEANDDHPTVILKANKK